MKKRSPGFTLIELLVVIAIIGILAALLLPSLGSATRKTKVAKVQTMIKQISSALVNYESDEGGYPPNETGAAAAYKEKNGGTYEYYSCTIIPYLDGDTGTKSVDGKEGHSRIQYMEFADVSIEETGSYMVYKDEFDSALWYHNFHTTNLTGRVRDSSWPYHPNRNAYKFRSFQIYSKIDMEDEMYLDGDKKKSKFQWVANYVSK